MAKGKLEVRLKPGERSILEGLKRDQGLISDAAAFRWLLAQGQRVNSYIGEILKDAAHGSVPADGIPSSENEAARERLRRIDAISPLCDWDHSPSQISAQAVAARKVWDRIMAEQQEFERIYNL